MRNARLDWLDWCVILMLLAFLIAMGGHVVAQSTTTIYPLYQPNHPPVRCMSNTCVDTVPFDVPPIEEHVALLTEPAQDGSSFTCEDKRRVLLTDEAGTRHCYLFYTLSEK